MARTISIPAPAPTLALPWTLLILSMLIASVAFGQGKLVDRRDQAEGWYLPVHGEVTLDGARAQDYDLILYKDNVELGKLKPKSKGRFELELDIDQTYTVRIMKEGFQEKMILVDTSIPEGLIQYPAYDCFVNLMPVNASNIDPFYTDFPSAVVRYNPDMGGFYHSEHYLSHIQTKLAGYASATF